MEIKEHIIGSITTVETVTYPGIASIARELANGVWAVSSTLMLIIIGKYILYEIGRNKKLWWKNPGVQLAGALFILVCGHWIRSLTQWIQFIQINTNVENFNIDSWWGSWRMFIVATLFVLAGKVLVIFSVSPYKWRWCITAFMLFMSIAVPLSIRFLI